MSTLDQSFGRRSLLLAGGAAAAAAVPGITGCDGESEAVSSNRKAFDDARRARIDVHHHFTAPAWVDWAQGQGLLKRDELPWWARWDIDSTLAVMDKAGVSTSVVSASMPVRRYRDRKQPKEGVSVAFQAMTDLVRSHPGRFAFFAPVFLQDLELSRWSVKRGLDDLGAVGVNTRAGINGVYLGDSSYAPLLAELNERSAVVNTHPQDLPGTDPARPAVPGVPSFVCDFPLDTTRAAINLILNGTLDRYPKLSFILPHGGGFLPYIATRLELFGGFLTPKIDAARVRDYLHRFYYDTAAPMAPSATHTLVDNVDPARVLYGTDWPATPATIISDIVAPALNTDDALTDRQRLGINRDNALRLMPTLAQK